MEMLELNMWWQYIISRFKTIFSCLNHGQKSLLIKDAIGQSEYNEYRFIWKDGNLQQCKSSHQFFKYTRKVNLSYSYEKNRSCQNFAFFNVFTGIDNRWETITTALQIAGLLGHQNKNLLSEIKSEIKYEDETEYDGETEIRHTTITNILNNNGTIQYQ